MSEQPLTLQQVNEVSSRSDCLYSEEEIEAGLDRLAADITEEIGSKNPVLLSVMNGAVIMVGKLAPRLGFPLQMDYVHATRYRKQTRGGELEWKHYPEARLTDKVVLVVDDILDEGDTLLAIKEYVLKEGASAVYTAVLVNKLHDRKAPGLAADFVGLEVEDRYLYGYGMDYKGYLRNAPGIYAVSSEDYD